MTHLLPLLTCFFYVTCILAQAVSPLPNVGIEISPSSVIPQPISTLSLRATAYSSIPNCDILSYTWSTLMTPIPATSTSSQPLFTTPNDRITSITGLITLGKYNFQITVVDCNSTLSLPFNAIVANSSLESDFFVLPPTIVTTPGFVFPPTLPPTATLPPTTSTSAPTIAVNPTTTPPVVDPSLPRPTDPNTGIPVGGGGGGEQQPNPPVVNAGQGGLNNSPSNNSNSFNIMYVVIPSGVFFFLLFLCVCLKCRRSGLIGKKISKPYEAFTGANQLASPV